MKVMIYFVFTYTTLALMAGVFYRRFTKAYHYDREIRSTSLGKMHAHLFALGVLFFLIVGLLIDQYHANKTSALFISFLVFYNIGLLCMVTMMLIRGIFQVAQTQIKPLSKKMNQLISNLAGVAHVMVTIGIILFLVWIIKSL